MFVNTMLRLSESVLTDEYLYHSKEGQAVMNDDEQDIHRCYTCQRHNVYD